MDLATIEREALNLPTADRAKLAQELLESLDQLSQAEIDALWSAEAKRRLAAYDSGEIAAVPAEIVLQKARKLLK